MSDPMLRRYLPFVAVLLLQGLLVALGPGGSDGGDSVLAGGASPGVGSPANQIGAGDAGPGAATATTVADSTAAGSAPVGSDATSSDLGGGPVTTAGPGGSATTLPAIPGQRDAMGRPLDGDRSKCAGLLQEDVTLQSPPCMPYIDDSNSGASSQGVTANEILVVIVYDEYDPAIQTALAANELAMTPEQAEELHQIYEQFFNERYEFHGRELRIEKYYSGGSTAGATGLRADAKEINETLRPFAALHYCQGCQSTPMADQLAREGILAFGLSPLADDFFIDRHPFVWTATMQGYRMTDGAADYWCKKMNDKNATLAGDPLMHTQKRKLAVGQSEDPVSQAQTQRFLSQIKGGMCNTDPNQIKVYTYSSDPDVRADQGPAIVQRMKEDGITTTYNLPTCAEGDNQRFFPENFMSTFVDDDFVGRFFAALCSSTQAQNTFGVGAYPKNRPESEKEKEQAAKAVDPAYDAPYLADGPFQALAFFSRLVQYAGPNLTPQTMYDGSRTMHQIYGWEQPNPPWDGWVCCNPYAPEHHVGIDANSYSTKTDLREIYWDNSAVSEGDGAPGAYVGVNDSRRYRPGLFPACDPKVAC